MIIGRRWLVPTCYRYAHTTIEHHLIEHSTRRRRRRRKESKSESTPSPKSNHEFIIGHVFRDSIPSSGGKLTNCQSHTCTHRNTTFRPTSSLCVCDPKWHEQPCSTISILEQSCFPLTTLPGKVNGKFACSLLVKIGPEQRVAHPGCPWILLLLLGSAPLRE